MLVLVYKLYELTSISDLLLFYVILFLLTIVIALLISVRYHYSVTPAFNTILCRLKLFTLLARRGILYLQCDDRKGSNSTKVARISGYNVPLIDSAIKPPAMPIVFSILHSSPSPFYFSQLILVPFRTDRKTFSSIRPNCFVVKVHTTWVASIYKKSCHAELCISFPLIIAPLTSSSFFAYIFSLMIIIILFLFFLQIVFLLWFFFQFSHYFYELDCSFYEFGCSLNTVTLWIPLLFEYYYSLNTITLWIS